MTDIDTAYDQVKARVVEEAGFCTGLLRRFTAEGRAPGVHAAGETRFDLSLFFAQCTDEDVRTMTSAIWAQGWTQGSISHGVNVRKGPPYLQWGKGYGGCSFMMTTVKISTRLEMTHDVTRVPELAAFKPFPDPERPPSEADARGSPQPGGAP